MRVVTALSRGARNICEGPDEGRQCLHELALLAEMRKAQTELANALTVAPELPLQPPRRCPMRLPFPIDSRRMPYGFYHVHDGIVRRAYGVAEDREQLFERRVGISGLLGVELERSSLPHRAPPLTLRWRFERDRWRFLACGAGLGRRV
jgi:hypothetical protein